MGRGKAVAVGLALALAGVAGCGDDEPAAAVSEEEFEEHAAQFCTDQAGRMAASAARSAAAVPSTSSEIGTIQTSDAEISSFLRSEYIPRTRAIVRELADFGFPPARDAELRAALNEVLAAAAQLERDTFEWIDDNRASRFDDIDNNENDIPDENYVAEVGAAFESIDLAPCAL